MKTNINSYSLFSRVWWVALMVCLISYNLPFHVRSAECTPHADSLVGWWPGDGTFIDLAGNKNGEAVGAVGFAQGIVGQAFVFDGATAGVMLGNPVSLRLQTFTIEAWIKRTSPEIATFSTARNGTILQYGYKGYGFGIWNDGKLVLSEVGIGSVSSHVAIIDTNFHHVAVTKSDGNVTFYLDGEPDLVGLYNPTFVFNTSAMIGASAGFYGLIDELRVYNQALTSTDIRSIYDGCSINLNSKPIIQGQPESLVAYYGGKTTLTVDANGSKPLTYQWLKDGLPIYGATNSSLVMINLISTDEGLYTVVVSNGLGSVISNPAALSISAAGVSLAMYAGITVEGVVGNTYGIQYSYDLSIPNGWNSLTNITLAQPIQFWMDPIPASQAKRFYRVVLLPNK